MVVLVTEARYIEIFFK